MGVGGRNVTRSGGAVLTWRRGSIAADVKPSNVLINSQGQVKMCDFGISGYLVDSVAKTMDAGCKPYMAVSARSRRAHALTGRVDVVAFPSAGEDQPRNQPERLQRQI